MNKHSLATASGLYALAAWSFSLSFIRTGSEALGPMTANAVIYIVGGGMTLFILFVRSQLNTLDLANRKHVTICLPLFALYPLLFGIAIGLASTREQAMGVGVIDQLWAPALSVLALICGYTVMKHRMGFALGITLAVIGGAAAKIASAPLVRWSDVFRELPSAPLPYALAFLAAICWAVYSLATRAYSRPGKSNVPAFMLATGVMFVLARILVREQSHWTWPVVLDMLLVSCLISSANFAFDWSMREGSMHVVSVAGFGAPIYSLLASTLKMDVAFNSSLVIAAILVALGAALAHRSCKNARNES